MDTSQHFMNPFATRKKQLITLLLLVLTGLSGKLFSQDSVPGDLQQRIRLVETSLGSWFKIEGEIAWTYTLNQNSINLQEKLTRSSFIRMVSQCR